MLAPTQDSAPVDSEWSPLEPPPTQATRPLSAEEKEILEVLQVQYKARGACQEFLFASDYSGDGVDDDNEDDMVDDDELEEMRNFFLKLFGENNELRKYYEKCWERGEFRCLVCGVADNKNVGKRFHDCVSLVQHSMSISRTKNKRAHSAFGDAVCNVLSWDINRLPTIVIKKEVKPPDTGSEPSRVQGKTNVNAADGEDGSLSSDKLDEVSGEQFGEPFKQNVEVVRETIKRVGELFAPTQDSAPEDSAWPPLLEPCPTQATHPLSAEEKETLEVLQGKTNENDDGKDGSLSSDKIDYKASVEQLGEPVKQGIEVVHETIKQVSEGEPDKFADDQVNRASNQNSEQDHDVPH